MYNLYVKIIGVIQNMLKNILIKQYKSLFKDIVKEYNNILNKNNGYYNYVKIINYEIKTIISAFNKLISTKKNTFTSIFEYDNESILHAIDKDLFNHIKEIFENVSMLLNME